MTKWEWALVIVFLFNFTYSTYLFMKTRLLEHKFNKVYKNIEKQDAQILEGILNNAKNIQEIVNHIDFK